MCVSGWFGDECSRGYCFCVVGLCAAHDATCYLSIGSCANCSVNGDCVSGFCRCHFGWDGPFCERPGQYSLCRLADYSNSTNVSVLQLLVLVYQTVLVLLMDCASRTMCVSVHQVILVRRAMRERVVIT